MRTCFCVFKLAEDAHTELIPLQHCLPFLYNISLQGTVVRQNVPKSPVASSKLRIGNVFSISFCQVSKRKRSHGRKCDFDPRWGWISAIYRAQWIGGKVTKTNIEDFDAGVDTFSKLCGPKGDAKELHIQRWWTHTMLWVFFFFFLYLKLYKRLVFFGNKNQTFGPNSFIIPFLWLPN